MTEKPSEAAIREACRRLGWSQRWTEAAVENIGCYPTIDLAASLIEQFQPETAIDPVTRRAREIYIQENPMISRDSLSKGLYDKSPAVRSIIRALKEGMPK